MFKTNVLEFVLLAFLVAVIILAALSVTWMGY